MLKFSNYLWGAKNRVGIGLSYRSARLHSLSELVSWNRFLGSLKVEKFGLSILRHAQWNPSGGNQAVLTEELNIEKIKFLMRTHWRVGSDVCTCTSLPLCLWAEVWRGTWSWSRSWKAGGRPGARGWGRARGWRASPAFHPGSASVPRGFRRRRRRLYRRRRHGPSGCGASLLAAILPAGWRTRPEHFLSSLRVNFTSFVHSSSHLPLYI